LQPFLFDVVASVGFCSNPLFFFRANLRFNLGSNPRLEFRSIADGCGGALLLLLFRAQPCLFFSLTLRVCFGFDSGSFLGASASIFFGPALSFFFSQSTRPFGGKLLRLFLCAAARVFLCVQAGLVFGSSLFGCLSTELRFNLCAQSGFFFDAQPGLLFGLPSGILIRAPLLGFIHQPLSVLGGAQARLLTILNPFDLFFDCAESHLRASPQLILLRAFGGFRFEIASLLFGTTAGLFFFRLPQRPEFAIVSRLRGAEFLINLAAAQFFD
jgi:hypothetical protein